jgi:hypothetical protein
MSGLRISQISLDMFGCLWISQIFFGPFGELIRVEIRRFPAYSLRYLYISNYYTQMISVQHIHMLSTLKSKCISVYICLYLRYPMPSAFIHVDLQIDLHMDSHADDLVRVSGNVCLFFCLDILRARAACF